MPMLLAKLYRQIDDIENLAIYIVVNGLKMNLLVPGVMNKD